MSRAERICRSLPTWTLRLIVVSPIMRGWWGAAWIELHEREIADIVTSATDEETGPWPVLRIVGRQ